MCQWKFSVAKRCMHVVCVQECNFIQSDKLWQECLVWHCKHALCVCSGLSCMCVSVCLQVETRASKHSVFTHSCVEQQLRGVYVLAWMSVGGEFPPWGPRPDSSCSKQESLLVCVTADKSDSQVCINEGLKALFQHWSIIKCFTGCVWLYQRALSNRKMLWGKMCHIVTWQGSCRHQPSHMRLRSRVWNRSHTFLWRTAGMKFDMTRDGTHAHHLTSLNSPSP